MGVQNAKQIASLLSRIPEEQITIRESQVKKIAESSGNVIEKMLKYLNLIEEQGGTLPRELISLSKALGTAGYLYDHLAWRNFARVLLEIRINRNVPRKQPSEVKISKLEEQESREGTVSRETSDASKKDLSDGPQSRGSSSTMLS